MKFTGTTIAALAPSVCQALVGNGWGFANSPEGGLKDITFGMRVANAPHVERYYFAQQYDFEGGMGYIGLQPQPDKDGKPLLRAVFSTFTGDSTTDHENCSQGADGGPGVSCGVYFVTDYSHTFELVIENPEGTKWTGKVVDTANGNSTEIGSWTLPAGTGGIKSGQLGFIENYAANDLGCKGNTKTEVTFFDPTTTTEGAGAGEIQEPYEYGDDCIGKVQFAATKVEDGWAAVVGF